MPAIIDLQAKLAELTARRQMQTETITRTEEELERMGIDIENPEEEISRLENQIEASQAKRARYLDKARSIIDRYEHTQRDQ